MLNPQLGLWVILLRDVDNRGSPGYWEAHPVCHVGVYTYMYLRRESCVFLTMIIKLWLANFSLKSTVKPQHRHILEVSIEFNKI